MYNYRQGEIHSAEFSDEFNALCIPFENSLSEEQIDIFHQILDCVSDTAAAEMRAAVYTAPTATAARTFCHTLPLTAHGHCPAKKSEPA